MTWRRASTTSSVSRRRSPGSAAFAISNSTGISPRATSWFTTGHRCPQLGAIPRAGTALWDAMGQAITELGQTLANVAEDERPEKIIVVIVTDGLENSSTHWTASKVAALVKQQTEEFNWQFLYLGANQDAIDEGEKMGIMASNSMTFHPSSAGITNTYESVSTSVSNYRGGITKTTQLTPADRQNAMQK